MPDPFFFLVALSSGILLGGILVFFFYRQKIGNLKTLSIKIFEQAENEAEEKLKQGELKLQQITLEKQITSEQLRERERQKLKKEEERLKEKEDKLESRIHLAEKKLSQIEKRESALLTHKEELDLEHKILKENGEKLMKELETLSGLTQNDAKETLHKKLIEEVQKESLQTMRRIKKEAEELAEMQVKRILVAAINRLAVSCVSQATVHTVSLPNGEIKGRIIGREGRNIRTLERLTGVNFLLDDTPNAVIISGFDPIRLHIAKMALTSLVQDGRIHPTSIEEAVAKAEENSKRKLYEYGEDAALRAGQINLDPELVRLLGALKLRYSFGQNVLEHSLEVSHIMGMVAAELGLDVALAKRIGLLHDIGKAVSHEVEGTHALIGQDLALRHGESKEVANGIGCHHGEIAPITIEASFCGSIDAVSASRPGARMESIEEYFKRLKKLENLAYEFPGIEKAYAMQAGRELVIAVLPEMIDDLGVFNLARDLTKRIEQELNYSGKIKVSVVREKKVVEYAV